MKTSTKKLTLMGVGCAAAMILSYIEFLLPPLYSAVPGIKPGFANIMIVFLLYRLGVKEAATVSVLRVALSALLFGTVMTFAYSMAGAVLSLLAMWGLSKVDKLSVVGVSIAGAVCHNAGQIIMAAILLETAEIGYYMAILAVTGVIAGVFVGIVGGLMLKYLPKI